MTAIYTIGHSNHSIEHFLGLLKQHGISTLVDVRSRPYSKWAPHFQKNPLSQSLWDGGVDYLSLGAELGDGHVDYARRAQAAEFQVGIGRLEKLRRSGPTAFMCAEEDPTRCHRRLLVTPYPSRRFTREYLGRRHRDNRANEHSDILAIRTVCG